MKFETYVNKIVLNHQPNFHKDPCKDARARGENASTCDALQRFRSESTKSRKYVFRPFLNRHQKKSFYSLLLIRPKYYESFKTEYSDFINRLTPQTFFLGLI